MSYDVGLYDREFLERAISQNLGDWTGAPELPAAVRRAIMADALRHGFEGDEQGLVDGTEFLLEAGEMAAQLTLFENTVSLTISGWDNEAFKRCLKLMKAWADEHGLALYDPQGGE